MMNTAMHRVPVAVGVCVVLAAGSAVALAGTPSAVEILVSDFDDDGPTLRYNAGPNSVSYDPGIGTEDVTGTDRLQFAPGTLPNGLVAPLSLVIPPEVTEMLYDYRRGRLEVDLILPMGASLSTTSGGLGVLFEPGAVDLGSTSEVYMEYVPAANGNYADDVLTFPIEMEDWSGTDSGIDESERWCLLLDPGLFRITLTPDMASAIWQIRAVRLIPPCPCDWDGDGELDLNDYFEFLGDFANELDVGDPRCGRADVDGDGVVTAADYYQYVGCLPDLNAMTACP